MVCSSALSPSSSTTCATRVGGMPRSDRSPAQSRKEWTAMCSGAHHAVLCGIGASRTPGCVTARRAMDSDDCGGSADFYTVAPCRVLDTRQASGPTLGAPLTCGTAQSFAVAGKCDVPAGAKAVSLNLTGTGLYRPGEPAPLRRRDSDPARLHPELRGRADPSEQRRGSSGRRRADLRPLLAVGHDTRDPGRERLLRRRGCLAVTDAIAGELRRRRRWPKRTPADDADQRRRRQRGHDHGPGDGARPPSA